MTRYIALLRGVNVGGHRKIPMAELRAFAEAIGLDAPRTLLQSGNLVFDAPDQPTETLEARLEAAARERLGLDTRFLLRTAGEWLAIAAEPLFPKVAAETPAKLLFLILKTEPTADAIAAAAATKGPEEFAITDRRLVIHFPEGMGQSKLSTAALERKLGVAATGRNWNTVQKLAAMARD